MAYKKKAVKTETERFDAQKAQIEEVMKRVEQKCLDENLSPWKWYLKHARKRPHNWVTKIPYRGTNAWVCGMLGVEATITDTQLTRIKDRMVGLPEGLGFDKDSNILRSKKYRAWEEETGKRLPKPRLYPTMENGEQVIDEYGRPKMHYADKLPILFTKSDTKKDDEGEPIVDDNGKEKKYWFSRLYWLYDIREIENLDTGDEIVEDAVEFVANMDAEKVSSEYLSRERITLFHSNNGGASCYSPSTDMIMMSEKEEYITPDYYYQTLFHEMGHSTGSDKRLKRAGVVRTGGFSNDRYAEEELVAEFCAIFSMADLNIEGTFENDCAYIRDWWEHLKLDPKKFARACNAGFKAKEFIFGNKNEEVA